MRYRHAALWNRPVSTLGFGASPLGGVYGAFDESDGIKAVHQAVEAGINFFDVAPFYGYTRAETALGKALSSLPRDQYLLSTKIGRYGEREFDFSAARTRQSLQESLDRLQTDVLDLVICHDIEYVNPEIVTEEALPVLQEYKQQGIIKAIGLSGYPLPALQDLITKSGSFDVVLTYGHFNLFNTTLLAALPFFQEHGLSVIAASPLAQGLLTAGGVPEWHTASPLLQQACQAATTHCKQAGISLAQLAMQYAATLEGVITTLVGMGTTKEVEQNTSWWEALIDPALLAEVQAIFAPVKDMSW